MLTQKKENTGIAPIVTKRCASVDGYFCHFRLLAIPTTTANGNRNRNGRSEEITSRAACDFLFTFSSNHGSILFGFEILVAQVFGLLDILTTSDKHMATLHDGYDFQNEVS